MGMRVIAIDGGDSTRDMCLSLGAEKFIDFTTTSDILSEVTKITTYGAHGVIVFAATKAGYDQAPHFLRPGGTMVCVGLPEDPTIIAGAGPITMCMKKLNIVGSVVGTLKDVEKALDFTARGLVKPILTHGELKDIDRFCQDINAGKLAGRAVIKIAA
jgi:propanol-preferring alcohol dehydrogenase